MKKLFTPIIFALVSLVAISAFTQQAEARRWRGALGFGIASAIVGGAIIASNRRAYGYYGGYGYGYPRYGYRSARYYGYDDYDDYYYAPRRSIYYSGYYAPYRAYGGYRVVRPYYGRRHRGLYVRY